MQPDKQMKRPFRIAKGMITVAFSLILLLGATACIYMQQAKFGEAPSGDRLDRIQQSPNFKNGKFQNSTETPTYAEGYSLWGELRKQIFKKYPRRYPADTIPSVKTDLLHIARDTDILVWFGHSSCFIQVDGKRILVDPVFSKNASPIPGTSKPFKGTAIYAVSDLPDIDYLLISHDHYDHLDYETIVALNNKTEKVICGLGVGAHFEHWGYHADKIIEKDWHEKEIVDSGFIIYTEPARHKSGRGFKQNNTLWLSFVLQTPKTKIYISGDSGYGAHFAAIGKQYGPIDLAIIENGQYDSAWHYIHCLPGEVLKAAQDLKAKRLLPVHSSKFVLARHPWDEPLIEITALSKAANLPLVTPLIGEVVYLNNTNQEFKQWWKGQH
jgi:L-ascorbate metabolism protein UlaG (beta-lactamase superfamily)